MVLHLLSERQWAFAAVIVGLYLVLTRILAIGIRGKNYPPGPPTLPIIGNLHQIPKKNIHEQYQKWAAKYGPIFHLKQGSSDVIVLANGDMIRQLVEKRSGNYADRPKFYIQDLYENSRIIMRGYDDMWKVERKLYHQFLSITKAEIYLPYQSLETKRLCVDLLESPEKWAAHMTRMTTSVSSSMAYGFRISDLRNETLQEVMRNAHGFFELVYSSKFLDWYPQLRRLAEFLPIWLSPTKKKAKELYRREKSQYGDLFSKYGKSREKSSLPSFAKDIALAQSHWRGSSNGDLLTDHAASYIAGVAFDAGADTTSNVLAGFMKAMVLFPEVQILARQELDKVIGDDRVPEMDDEHQLPYIHQTIKEAVRWFPTGLNGAMPHAARDADTIGPYTIPRGAGIVLAVWSANNDPSLFPNPRVFDPSRQSPDTSIFEASTAADTKAHDVGWTFGAGRRICPGMHVAERTLFLTIARLLWGFDIGPAKDENGNVIEVDRNEVVTQTISARPVPFKCSITPRSAKRAEIMKTEWAKAEELLDENGDYRQSVI